MIECGDGPSVTSILWRPRCGLIRVGINNVASVNCGSGFHMGSTQGGRQHPETWRWLSRGTHGATGPIVNHVSRPGAVRDGTAVPDDWNVSARTSIGCRAHGRKRHRSDNPLPHPCGALPAVWAAGAGPAPAPDVGRLLGCAASQLGPRALALATQLNKDLGLPYGKTAAVLEQACGLRVSGGGLGQAFQRVAGKADLSGTDPAPPLPPQRHPGRNRLEGRRTALVGVGLRQR